MGKAPLFLAFSLLILLAGGCSPPEETPAPARYNNPVFQVSLDYPASWQPAGEEEGPGGTPARYQGEDGYFLIAAMGGEGWELEQVAENEANHHLRPYGTNPKIEETTLDGRSGIYIFPDADAGMENQSAFIVEYPRPVTIGDTRYHFFMLYADESHIKDLASTLQFHQPEAPQETAENLFDAREVKAGDVMAGMTVVSVETGEPYRDSEYPARVQFSGPVTLSGEYTCYPEDHEFLAGLVAFKVDPAEEEKLPRLKHDERYPWLVFSNQEAARIFGPPGGQGQAKVVIDRYQIHYAPSEVYNQAELVEVVQEEN
jgi:hypothetical protein